MVAIWTPYELTAHALLKFEKLAFISSSLSVIIMNYICLVHTLYFLERTDLVFIFLDRILSNTLSESSIK